MLSLRAVIKNQNFDQNNERKRPALLKPQNSAISGLALKMDSSSTNRNFNPPQPTHFGTLFRNTPSRTIMAATEAHRSPSTSPPHSELLALDSRVVTPKKTPEETIANHQLNRQARASLLMQKQKLFHQSNFRRPSAPSFGSFLQQKVSQISKESEDDQAPEGPESLRKSLEELQIKKGALSPWANPMSPHFDDSIPRLFPQELRKLIEESRQNPSSEKPYLLIDLRTNRLELPMIEGAIPLPAPVLKSSQEPSAPLTLATASKPSTGKEGTPSGDEKIRTFFEEVFSMGHEEWESRFSIPKIENSELKNKMVIFYSTSGKRSDVAVKICQKFGLENVKSLVGGTALYWDMFGTKRPVFNYSPTNI